MSGGQEVGVCVGSRPMDTPQQERGKGKSREDFRSLIGSGAQTPTAAKAFLVTLPFEDFHQRVIMLVARPPGEAGRGALGVIGRQEAHRSLPSGVLTPTHPPTCRDRCLGDRTRGRSRVTGTGGCPRQQGVLGGQGVGRGCGWGVSLAPSTVPVQKQTLQR